jgi:hypothetical protein
MSYRKYDSWMQDVLRSIVAQKLWELSNNKTEENQQCIYITFKTQFKNAVVPEIIAKDYPEHMTIVLDNNYYDLVVDGEHFHVGLSIQGVPMKITVPFLSIVSFVDTKTIPVFSLTFDQNIPSLIESLGVWRPLGQHNAQKSQQGDFYGIFIAKKFLPEQYKGDSPAQMAVEKNKTKEEGARILNFVY